MTKDELDAIGARFNARRTTDGECILAAYAALDDDVPALLAEVRRLQGLIKQAEWAGGTNDWTVEPTCPWCGGDMPEHRPDCPTFPAFE